LKVQLAEAEAARAKGEQQLRRAQSFADADLVWGKNDKGKQDKIVLVAVFTAWNVKRLESQLKRVVEHLDVKKVESAEASRCLEPLRAAVHFAQRRAGRRASLAMVFCSWATQYLQHVSRQTARREAEVQRRTSEKLDLLRKTVMDLVDDTEAEGAAEYARMTPSKLGSSRRLSQTMGTSIVSSIAGSTCSWSEDDTTPRNEALTPRQMTRQGSR